MIVKQFKSISKIFLSNSPANPGLKFRNEYEVAEQVESQLQKKVLE